ncbi:hypothetical protein F4825DRAFT_471142 [Nemania diffusa]|nr:hypothetical protein F4825DRAFT_471142 [Nemania diffusa]
MERLPLSQQWESDVQRCLEPLESDDRDYIRNIGSYQQLERELANFSKYSRRLSPLIQHFRCFSLFFATSIGLSGTAAGARPLCGMLGLIIKVTRSRWFEIVHYPIATKYVAQLATYVDNTGIEYLLPLLKDAGLTAEAFSEYLKPGQPIDAFNEAVFDAHVTLLRLGTDVIHFFHKNPVYTLSDASWKPLTSIFHTCFGDMDQALLRLEKLDSIHTQATRIWRRHSFLSDSTENSSTILTPSTDVVEDKANLPCIVLPSSRFALAESCNRDSILNAIRAHFDHSLEGVRTIALTGVGGVGKSHIAHKFAYLESQKSTYDAVLWIQSDTPSSIQQSFTEAAVRLQLPGASPQDHTENKIRVLTWLEQTSCSWLLIFDNARDVDLLANYWPTASRGHIIITTENHALWYDPAYIKSIEVTSFESDGGSKLLMQLLPIDVANDVKDGEVKSEWELFKKLCSHVQAVPQTAGWMHRQSWIFIQLLVGFEQSFRQSTRRALDALWRLSFNSLATESSNFLGVVAYIAPDSIPQELFKVKNVSDLPMDLKFCVDDSSFSEVLENLTALALVKRDEHTKEFSIHRLIQARFIDFMSTSGRQQAFWNATQLVFNAFPRSGGRMGQLYLIEQVDLDELHDLSDLALQAYATLEEDERDLYLDGLIHNQKGCSWYLRGNFELAEKHWKIGLDLHVKISPVDLRAVAWRSYNMGLVTAAREDYERAVEWYLDAEKRWIESGDETLSCIACIRSQRAQALTFLRRFDEAKECFNFSILHLKTSQEWGWLAFTYFAEGNYFRDLSQFGLAESKYRAAQDAWKTGDQTCMHDFYAACLFKLGCAAMDQGDFAKAKEHFDHARNIVRAQSPSRPADYDRILNRLY